MRKHRVFASYLGKIAFVNAFPDVHEAAVLTMKLRNHFKGFGLTVWHDVHDHETQTDWRTIKTLLLERQSERWLRSEKAL